MTAPLSLYGAALRRAAVGEPAPLNLIRTDGAADQALDAADWSGALRPGDRKLVGRCQGATLDVGCGPGRLAAALTRNGRPALGLDISAEAVRQTRRRGAPAHHGCVFGPLPGEGRWTTVLLADGNIGIGGDPERLLSRCLDLLHQRGTVLVELAAPGAVSWRCDVRLRHDDRLSATFPWASVGARDIAELARRSALGVRHLWMEADRWFAELARR